MPLRPEYQRSLKSLLIRTHIFPYIVKFIPYRDKEIKQYTFSDLEMTGYGAISGHFAADQFDNLIKRPHLRTIVFRDPKSRVDSHYKYFMSHFGRANQRIKMKYRPGLTYREFALSDEMSNWQTRALSSRKIEEFDVIGVTENLDSFIRELDRRLGHAFEGPIQRLNEAIDKREFSLEGADLAEFLRKNEDDYNLYERAKEIASGNK